MIDLLPGVDQRVHRHDRTFVFSDGAVLGDIHDAIAAAGAARNYQLAHELSVRYALDVCVRCARRLISGRVPLTECGIRDKGWGSVCELCRLQLLVQLAHHE